VSKSQKSSATALVIGHTVVELVGEKSDAVIVEDKAGRRRPLNASELDRPDLGKPRLRLRRKFPSAHDVPADTRTHDVNEKVLAEAYRAGLRVTNGHKTRRRSLGFLFGGDGAR